MNKCHVLKKYRGKESNGTEGCTELIYDINLGAADWFANLMIAMNDTLFFMANDGTHSEELWTLEIAAANDCDFNIIRGAGANGLAVVCL